MSEIFALSQMPIQVYLYSNQSDSNCLSHRVLNPSIVEFHISEQKKLCEHIWKVLTMDSRDKADISEVSSQAIDHDEDHLKGEKAEITFN